MTSNQPTQISVQSSAITISENEDDDTTLVSHTPSSSTSGFLIICIIICIPLIVIVILMAINNMGVINDKDISRIPLSYELSLKRLYSFNNRFDYVINKIPTTNYINENEFNSQQKNLSSSTNTTSTTMNTTNTHDLVLAELISRSLIIIPPGWYEVQEFRYNTSGMLIRKVLTTNCHIEFTLSSIWSAPDVIIQFTTNPLLNLAQEFTLQESMKYCKWKITWTFIMNGYIHKLCPKNLKIRNPLNNTNEIENMNVTLFDNRGYEKVAYFKGWEFFGFTFLSLDSKINYGYTTVPNLFKMMSRNVYITKDAPFPPIIPAIYTAYYNYITNSRSSKTNRKKNKYNK